MSRRVPCSPWRAAQAPGTVAPSFPGFGRWVTLAVPATPSASVWVLNWGIWGLTQRLLPPHPALVISDVAWILACLMASTEPAAKRSPGLCLAPSGCRNMSERGTRVASQVPSP